MHANDPSMKTALTKSLRQKEVHINTGLCEERKKIKTYDQFLQFEKLVKEQHINLKVNTMK